MLRYPSFVPGSYPQANREYPYFGSHTYCFQNLPIHHASPSTFYRNSDNELDP